MRNLNFDKKSPSIFKMIEELDEDGDSELDFAEFIDIMTARISNDNTREDLRRIYKLFDTDRTD